MDVNDSTLLTLNWWILIHWIFLWQFIYCYQTILSCLNKVGDILKLFRKKLLSKSNSCEIWKSVYLSRITVVDLRWRTCFIGRCLVWFRDDVKQQENCNTLFSDTVTNNGNESLIKMHHPVKCQSTNSFSTCVDNTNNKKKTVVYLKKETVVIVLINLVKQKTWHISWTLIRTLMSSLLGFIRTKTCQRNHDQSLNVCSCLWRHLE